MRQSLWYIQYVDQDGNDESALVYAPSQRMAVALMHPFEVINILEIEEAIDDGLVAVYENEYLEDEDDD